MKRILVIGVPRSGTTWVCEVLGLTAHGVAVQEPDNPDANPLARPVQRSRGVHPSIGSHEAAADYRRLWDPAFTGGWPAVPTLQRGARALGFLPPTVLRPSMTLMGALSFPARRRVQTVVAKSVLATFALDWLVAQYAPAVVVVERDPLNVVASWVDLGIPIANLQTDPAILNVARQNDLPAPDLLAAHVERVAWCVGLLSTIQARAARDHREWTRVRHDVLAAAPAASFRQLFSALGLAWSPRVDVSLEHSDAPGRGYQTRRRRADLPGAWRGRLTIDDAERVHIVLSAFPLSDDTRSA